MFPKHCQFGNFVVRLLPAGDTAVVVEFGDRVDRALSDAVLALSARVRAAGIKGLRETVPTYRSLLVHFDPLQTNSAGVTRAIKSLLGRKVDERNDVTLWHVPVCYEPTHAPDLADVAQRTGLTTDDVVRLHSETRFHVYMVGFSPGFPYMGDLPEALSLPRRVDPRIKVPAGSIAIAAEMTGIYPVESPGGWHLIGTTPIRLFDLRRPRGALLSPGDKVKFEPVSSAQYDRIRAAVATDAYSVPNETMSA
jgi:KipI family sensor histidine kinase inhibitor